MLSVPAGYEAILVRDGAFLVYREGDEVRLGEGLFARPGSLYFVDMQATAALNWGTGGIKCDGHTCGLHGTLRLQVGSSRKFLGDNLGKTLPLTAQKAFEGVLEPFLSVVRAAVRQNPLEELIRHPRMVADAAQESLEECLEAHGLLPAELFVEEVFAADAD